jgi:hypothetical protein
MQHTNFDLETNAEIHNEHKNSSPLSTPHHLQTEAEILNEHNGPTQPSTQHFDNRQIIPLQNVLHGTASCCATQNKIASHHNSGHPNVHPNYACGMLSRRHYCSHQY